RSLPPRRQRLVDFSPETPYAISYAKPALRSDLLSLFRKERWLFVVHGLACLRRLPASTFVTVSWNDIAVRRRPDRVAWEDLCYREGSIPAREHHAHIRVGRTLEGRPSFLYRLRIPHADRAAYGDHATSSWNTSRLSSEKSSGLVR